jgi:L-ascorbate metabolism protein UlaG (beta-lactamase superfamily)
VPTRRLRYLVAATGFGLAVFSASSCGPSLFTTQTGPLAGDTVEIRYHGHNMVAVQDRLHRVLIDPYQPHLGFPVPSVTADLVLVSERNLANDNLKAVQGPPRVFEEPGMFVMGDLTVVGVPTSLATSRTGRNTAFRFQLAGVDVVHLGDAETADLTDQEDALLRGADIMFVPVGGGTSLDASGAAAVVRTLAPRVAIPTHYRVGPSTLQIADVQPFLERFPGRTVRQLPSRVRVTAENLPAPTEIWVLDWR